MTASRSPGVYVSRDGGICTVEFVGAKSMNILDSAAAQELTTTFADLGRDDAARVVVLRGAGDKAFIGGADIGEMATLDRHTAEYFIRGLADLCEAIRSCPAVVIARLDGWCLGGGLEVAASCDLRIAATDAKFEMPEVSVGVPSVIHAALLPALIGSARTAWLLLTCETVGAGTAADWGLVHEVVAPERLDVRIRELAAKLNRFAPQALRQQKRILNRWNELTTRQAIEDSVEQFGLAYLTGEPQDHMQQFIARKNTRRA